MRGKVAGRIRHKTCSFSLAIRIFALVTNKSLSRHCENRDTLELRHRVSAHEPNFFLSCLTQTRVRRRAEAGIDRTVRWAESACRPRASLQPWRFLTNRISRTVICRVSEYPPLFRPLYSIKLAGSHSNAAGDTPLARAYQTERGSVDCTQPGCPSSFSQSPSQSRWLGD